MSISPTLVYVVDDDTDFGMGLERFFRCSGFQPQSFNAGQAFLDAYPTLRPGCLFIDLAMPGMSGRDLLQRLRAAGCLWPAVFLTGNGGTANAEQAMRADAFAFLEKPPREVELLAAATRGEALLGSQPQLMYDGEIARRVERLSPRERAVFDAVLEGLLNKQIAARLGISESTVKSSRRSVMERMQAGSSVELVAMALRGGVSIKSRT